MRVGDLVKVVHPGGLFGPINQTGSDIIGLILRPPNEVSVVEVYWLRQDFLLPRYIHIEEIEVVYRVDKD